MPLIVETGAGVAGADSYAAQGFITTYWSNRPHLALATTWADADADKMDGAAREATAYLDAVYGQMYRGTRAGYVQGLQWPRSMAKDDEGFDLPDLPNELRSAVAELAVRALKKPLKADTSLRGVITKKSSKAGPVSTSTDYGDGAVQEATYSFVTEMLAPVLNGLQGGGAQWNWR